MAGPRSIPISPSGLSIRGDPTKRTAKEPIYGFDNIRLLMSAQGNAALN
jgi:hypothetical protein